MLSIADLPAERARLAKYYTGDFVQEFEKRNTGKKLDMAQHGRRAARPAMNLQYQYIAANPHPLGSKSNLDRANDGSRYSELHGALHPFLRTALRQFGLYDIFLIEPRSGTIVYTVFKELDFATSLVNGPYREDRASATPSASPGRSTSPAWSRCPSSVNTCPRTTTRPPSSARPSSTAARRSACSSCRCPSTRSTR